MEICDRRIYELVSGQLCLYVGQTVRTLKRRAYVHKYKSNSTASRHIPNNIDWEIKLIEELPETTREQATVRERYWFEIKKPLYNENVPGRSKQEFDKVHNQTPERKASKKAYKQTPEYKAYEQAYRAKKKLLLEQE